RDLTVTGVQTCALPIYADKAGRLVHDTDVGEGAADINSHAKVLHDTTSFRTRARHVDVETRARAHPDMGSRVPRAARSTGEFPRSEERRVGKEVQTSST